MARHGLVIRFSSLGDIILASAPVLNLKIAYPDHRILFLTKERFAPVATMMDGVDEVVTIPDDAGPADLYRCIRSLHDHSFGFVADLHGNVRSWTVRKVQTADRIAVYPKRRMERRHIARTHQIPASWPHTIDLYNDCVTKLGGRGYVTRPSLRTFIAKIPLPFEDRKYAVIAPGAAHETKKWPVERFARVAEELHQQFGLSIVWAVTSADAGLTPAQLPDTACIELVDSPIPDLAGVVEHAALTIANDSGIAHLSSAVGTPVLALFGPTHPALGFAPRGLLDRIVEVDEYCRPCSIHGATPCFREERYCFTRIDAADVITSAKALLSKTVDRRPALFVDRDGTLIEERHFLKDPGDISFIPGAIEGLQEARYAGYRIVIVSNQSGVARGYFDLDTVERVNGRLMALLLAHNVEVDGLYYCPHYPGGEVPRFSRVCDCRKPATGMVEQAALDLKIDLRRSVVIGDKLDDCFLGLAMGGRSILVGTGHGEAEAAEMPSIAGQSGVTRAADLAGAIRSLLK